MKSASSIFLLSVPETLWTNPHVSPKHDMKFVISITKCEQPTKTYNIQNRFTNKSHQIESKIWMKVHYIFSFLFLVKGYILELALLAVKVTCTTVLDIFSWCLNFHRVCDGRKVAPAAEVWMYISNQN